MKKLIIIPAYNEGACIEATVREIIRSAPDCDYVIINDCSTDNTQQICEKNQFNTVNLPVNLGIGGAVRTGYQYALENGYDLALQVDGDGQHNPSFLREMEAYLTAHDADMVIGSRFIQKEGFQSSWIRRIGIVYFTWLIKLCTGKTITDPTSGFRMIGKKAIELFAQCYPMDYPEPESIVIALNHNCKIEEIPVIMRERQGGVSSITITKSIHYMIKVTLAILKETLRGAKHKSS